MGEELSRLQCIPKAEFDPADLTGTFQPMNGTGLSDDIKMWKIFNPSSTHFVEVSLDGVTPHDFIPPLSTFVLDVQTNHYDGPIYGAGTLNMARGQIIWGRTAPNPSFLQFVGYR